MVKLNKDNNGFSAIEVVLVLVTLAIVGIGSYFVAKHIDTKKTVTSLTSTSKTSTTTPKATTPPAKPTDPTTGWATYTSTLGSFSIKYPSTGWSLDGFQGETPVGPGYSTGSMNGSESQVRLFEDTSTNASNQYAIVININKDSGQAASETSNQYPNGSVSSLGNGLQVWQTNASAVTNPACFSGADSNAPIDLDLVSNGNFDMQLKNGEYMSFLGSFCYGQKATTTYTYQQQVGSPEWTIAKEVLNSLTQQ